MMDIKNKRLTKIICTIGSRSSDLLTLMQLAEQGMDIARINMSHGNHKSHQETIDNIRVAERRLGVTIGIALDTRGPELRIGEVEGGLITIKAGDVVRFTNNSASTQEGAIFLPFPGLLRLERGTEIFIDDGLLKLEVTGIEDKVLTARAENSHAVKSRKGVNIPGLSLGLPYLSSADKEDITFGLKNGIDFIFASFVSGKDDIYAINSLVSGNEYQPEVIAKIESLQGLNNLEEILSASSGAMIARGDLAVEIGHEKVFPAQKRISSACLRRRKVLICATQMMESMVNSPLPTRAEVSDVGNAVLDGCDCVMLSGETASGHFPVQAVEFMSKICLEAEFSQFEKRSRYLNGPKGCFDIKEAGKNEKVCIFTKGIKDVDRIRHRDHEMPLYIRTAERNAIRKLQIRRGCFPAEDK